MVVRNNLIQRVNNQISLNNKGLLNGKILFSGGMGRGRRCNKHKNARVKVQNDIRMSTYTYINKQISSIFNCVAPEIECLACSARLPIIVACFQMHT